MGIFLLHLRPYFLAHSWSTNGTGYREQNCPFGAQGTNYCLSCDHGYYLTNNNCIEIEQLLFYREVEGTKIFKYGIKPTSEGFYIDEFETPYSANNPNLVYNSDYGMIEIIGDYKDTSNIEHWHMNEYGGFSKFNSGRFGKNTRVYERSTFVFVPAVGTLQIGGVTTSYVYIITQKTDWPLIPDAQGENALGTIQGSSRFGFTSNENTIFLVGDYDLNNEKLVQSIDFDGVKNLNEAKSRTWNTLGSLDKPVINGGIVYYDSKLIVLGGPTDRGGVIDPHGSPERSRIQIFDLDTNISQMIGGVIERGKLDYYYNFPMTYESNGILRILGGDSQYDHSIEQYFSLENIGESTKISSSDTSFKGLIASNGYGGLMRFTSYYVW